MRCASKPLLATSNMNFKVGDKAFTTVSVAGGTQKMASEIIVAAHNGWCEVDVMSLHGGAPRIQFESNMSLIPFEGNSQ